MTRINLVPPEELVRQHLVAEYRELPRVFGLVRDVQAKGLPPRLCGIPPKYTLGTGHVKFFYDKLGFLVNRQQLLVDEMHKRGYSTTYDISSLGKGINARWFGDYEPDDEAIALSRSRIQQRLTEMGYL